MNVGEVEVVAPSGPNSTEFCDELCPPRCTAHSRTRVLSVGNWVRSVVFCVAGSDGTPIGPEGSALKAGFVPLWVSVYLFVVASKLSRYLLLLATARPRA